MPTHQRTLLWALLWASITLLWGTKDDPKTKVGPPIADTTFPVGWVFRSPYSQTVLLIGIICVVVALLSMLIRPQGHSQHYWRGRPVDLPPESWTDRLYRLLYRG